MKNHSAFRALTQPAAVAAAIAFAVLSGAGSAAAAQMSADSCRGGCVHHAGQPVDPLVGVWKTTVGLVNCVTHTPLGPAFQSLLTFSSDGTLSETTSAPSFAVGQRGEGMGTWLRAGVDADNRNVYKASSEAFILFTSDANPPVSPGFLAGSQTIDQVISFDDDLNHWSANAAVSFTDGTGNIYRQACAEATAVRY